METIGKNGVDLPESPATASESAVEKHLRSYFPDLFEENGHEKVLTSLRFSVEPIHVDDQVVVLSLVDQDTKSSVLNLTRLEGGDLVSLNPGYSDLSPLRKGHILSIAAFYSMENKPLVVGHYTELSEETKKAKLFFTFLYNQELSLDELANGLLYE